MHTKIFRITQGTELESGELLNYYFLAALTMGSREEEMEGSIKVSLLLWREWGRKGWREVLIRLVCYTGRREEGMAGSVRLVCCSGRLCTGFNKWTKVPSVSFSTQAFKIKHFKPSSVKSWRASWKITRILHARMDLPWGTAVHNRLSILDQAHSPCMHECLLRNCSPQGTQHSRRSPAFSMHAWISPEEPQPTWDQRPSLPPFSSLLM